MSELFTTSQAAASARPLAERMRPASLDEFVGQADLVGPGGLIRRLMEARQVVSLILWGPPGTGKTTLARLMADFSEARFVSFSAVLSGVKEVREVIAQAAEDRRFAGAKTLLFVDEIHRFNKAQQDAFLPHVESGLITLIGATTENPSFEVIPALTSRLRVLVLKPLGDEDISGLLDRALADEERGLGLWRARLAPEARALILASAQGDARAALNGLELAVSIAVSGEEGRVVNLADAQAALQRRGPRYDKAGDEHYNLISALHKSLRDSDPDAALYWLARMLEAGEDRLYLFRRMLRFASEDVGLADPVALMLGASALDAFRLLGQPEGDLALAHLACYLALAEKSNAVYTAFKAAARDAREHGPLAPPMNILNAPTGLMKDLGYAKGYQYAHDQDEAIAAQPLMPEQLEGRAYLRLRGAGRERALLERLNYLKRKKQELKGRK